VAHVVLRIGAGFVILAVTELATLQRAAADQILPVPASVLPRGRLLAGLVEWDGEQCLVLNPTALADDPDIADLAAASVVCDADTAAASAVAAGRGAAYLSYRAGGEFATALDQIVEIIPVPAGYPATGTGDGLLGVTAHRAAALPLICLATRLGKRPAPDNPCVLVVDIDGTQTGFVVDGLGAIDTADWSGRTGAAADRDPERRRLVRMRDSQRTVTDLDLRAFS
jgi:purine-binding chemotaxis protein CheW